MAKDHAKETIHPPPHKEGKTRVAVGADKTIQSDTKRIEFDYDKYADFLADADLSEAQKLELLQAIWNIMSEFVMLGFGIHPIQQACGKVDFEDTTSPKSRSILLGSEHKHLIAEFDDVAAHSDEAAQEGVEA